MGIVYSSTFTHPRIDIIDSATSAILTTVTPGFTSTGLAVSPDDSWLAVCSNGPGVQFMNTATHTFGPVITTGLSAVMTLVWAHDSSLVYCVGQYGVQTCTPAGVLGTLGVVSDAGFATQAALSPDGSHIYVGAGTKVYELTTSLFAFTNIYSGLAGSQGICISPDGHTLYVSDYQSPSGSIYLINVATGAMSVEGANNAPGALALSADGSRLWCAEAGSGQVQVFNAGSGAVLQTIAVPRAYVLALSTDGTQMWVGVSDGSFPPVVVPIDTTTYALGTGVDFGGFFAQIVSIAAAPGAPPGPSSSAAVALGPLAIQLPGSGGPPPVISGSTVTGSAVLNIGPLVVQAADVIATRFGTVIIGIGPLQVVAVGARLGPGGLPIPGFRGRWRLTLHTRTFAPATLASTMIAELADARGRRLTQAWNTPATLTFTMDGHSQAAGVIEELFHDVVAWRWDDQIGQEFAVFRGPITQSEDQLSEQAHVVTYTCHDYAAVLQRRLLTATYTVTARDQDLIAGDLLGLGSSASSSSGTSFSPASYLPVNLYAANPNGSTRGLSGRTRDRTYYGSQNVGQALDDLAKIINGFDWDVQPSATGTTDLLRVFYPQQGITRSDMALQYGSTVARVTRAVNSADYANYVRVLGNNGSATPTPQKFGEHWDATATSIATPVGLWMSADDAADVTVQSTLDEKASGDLALDQILVPHYTLGLSAEAYTWGNPNMGDTVPLIIQSGRLNVNTSVRVLGIAYDIGDDGQEDVDLVVSRPPKTLRQLLFSADRDIESLARR
jgi:hypothetical protein